MSAQMGGEGKTMSDRIIDRISALQDEIGLGRRRIEKLEAENRGLRDVLILIADDANPNDLLKRLARAALSTKERTGNENR